MKKTPKKKRQPRVIPQRMCAVCRERFEKKELMRLAQNADGTWRFDISGKAQGRGMYLCRRKDCLNRVLEGKKLPFRLSEEAKEVIRSLCGSEPAHADGPSTPEKKGLTPDSGEAELQHREEEKILNLIGLAAKSGQIASGFDASLNSMREGSSIVVLTACDVSEASLRRMLRQSGEAVILKLHTTDKNELGRRLGRSSTAFCSVNDIHLANGILKLTQNEEDRDMKNERRI